MQLAGENTSSGSGRPGPTRGLAGVLNRGTRARSAEGGERGESGSESDKRGAERGRGRGRGCWKEEVGRRDAPRAEQDRVSGWTHGVWTDDDRRCLCCPPLLLAHGDEARARSTSLGVDGGGRGRVGWAGERNRGRDGRWLLVLLAVAVAVRGGLRGGSRRRRSRVLLGAVEGLPVGWVRGCSMREAAGWGRCRTVSGRESGQGGGTQSTYGDFLKAAQCRHQVGREGESVCARAREAGERRAGEGGATGDGGRATRRRRVCSGCSSHRLEKVGGSESARGSDDLAQST